MLRLPSAGSPAPPDQRDLGQFLVALAQLVQRQGLAPEGDPDLEAAYESLGAALDLVLDGREEIRVEVGEVQLLVEGMGTNPDFEPLRELAQQLCATGLVALEFRRGITRPELVGVLSALANHPGGPSVARVSGPHLGLVPRVEPPPTPEEAWLGLVRAALEDPAAGPDSDLLELTATLELHSSDPAWERQVLEALARAARAGPGLALAGLIDTLPAATLRRLLGPRGDRDAQRQLLEVAGDTLPPPVAVRLLVTAAHAHGRPFAPAVQRLLAKLANIATHGRPLAREALARELRRAVDGVLGDSDEAPAPPPAGFAAEPERVLKLSLESGVLEEGTLVAVDRMVARRQVTQMVSLLETVPREDPVGRALRQRLFHPRTVRQLLETSPPDLEALERLIPGCGIEAAPALINALVQARERRIRLRLLELASRYGDAIGPLLVERLAGAPWYVQRNMLHLLGRLSVLPPTLELTPFVRHGDVRVRHEAVAILIADPATRDQGLAEGLAGRHEPTVRLALATLAERPSPELTSRVMVKLSEPGWSEETRAAAVAAIAPVRDAQVLRILRRLVMGRNIVGMGRLAPKSPTMLAALRGLATWWVAQRGVLRILEAARDSRDAEVRDAARGLARRASGGMPKVVS
jgi:hypothetical protein